MPCRIASPPGFAAQTVKTSCFIRPRAPRARFVVSAYRSANGTANPAPQALTVSRITPASSLELSEAACKAFGEAYMFDALHREVKTQLGREKHLFSGLSRVMLDSFGSDAVLFITESGPAPASAAAVLLSNSQEAEMLQNLQQLDFNVIPGTLQMLQAIPQSSMATVTATMERLHLAGQSAVQEAGYNSYLKLMLLGVRPCAQGMGLGGALLAAVKAAADEQQLPLLLQMGNRDLVAMCQRNGFAMIGKSECRTLMLRVGQANEG